MRSRASGSPSRRVPAWLGAALVVAGFVASGCGANPDTQIDASVCEGSVCTGGCDVDGDCRVGRVCDVASHQCVECTASSQCAVGQVCHPSLHACVAGCGGARSCGEAGVCEADAGFCAECVVSADCHDPARPVCDPVVNRCFACLPSDDRCGHAMFCASVDGAWSCLAGCKGNPDCAPPSPSDGGVGDGGSGDGGTGDGGVAAGPALCDVTLHRCVSCLGDGDCAAGKICTLGACVDGCNDKHACPAPAACCDGHCADLAADPLHCGACGTACKGGYQCCGGACSDPRGDVANCGSCGVVCKLTNGVPLCSMGECTVGLCTTGWGDCNGHLDDGCETNVSTNVDNCGYCGNVCSLANAKSKCGQGVCAIDACIYPWADCDGRSNDGCEVRLSDDVKNCGGCGLACSGAHVPSPLCDNRQCVGACEDGWSDCNHDRLADGCEVATASDVKNCGACGLACALPHVATPGCVMGACTVGACAASFVDCNKVAADGCEINVTNDTNNCGGCGMACSHDHATPACVASRCQVTCNDPAFGNCDGDVANGCETDLGGTPAHCGACGAACSANHIPSVSCTAGSCGGACEALWADCNGDKRTDGCETAIGGDVRNCGACGRLCPSANGKAACNNGACELACNMGYADCDKNPANGCEVALNTLANCGGCNVACGAANAQTSCGSGTCVITACAGGFADCDGNLGNGCEAVLGSDVANCGACRKACSAANGTPSCVAGSCRIACAAGFGNCDGNVANGCEDAISGDVNNCGACGAACSHNNNMPSCVSGACTIACTANHGNCDGNDANGCETQLTSLTDCGACGQGCGAPNAVTSCAGGTCAIAACAVGFADCDGKIANGCETAIGSDVANCGACNKVCSNFGGAPTCANGACGINCAAGRADCDGNVANGCEVDVGGDPNNCGGCAVHCSTNNIAVACVAGQCAGGCKAGFADCNGNKQLDGCEVSTQTSARNCGGCGVACSSNHISFPTCLAGACNGQCDAGFVDCNGDKLTDGCETGVRSDPDNCGGCGAVCATANVATRQCIAGACSVTCSPGFDDCNGDKNVDGANGQPKSDGCETDLNANVVHCGSCGSGCQPEPNSAPTCKKGACLLNCFPGFADCDHAYGTGCESAVDIDPANCGGCGTQCSGNNISTPTCLAANCNGACNAGFADCDGNKQANGCEQDISSTPNSCGGCNLVCSNKNMQTRTCGGGICNGTCASGWSDCDGNKLTNGCEQNTDSDVNNCGGCSFVCSNSHMQSRACSGSKCTGNCANGFGDCNSDKLTDGCESPLAIDVNNCGGCGAACSTNNISAVCANNQCNTGTCNAGFADCNTDKRTDGCEVDLNGDAANCGGCNKACSNNNMSTLHCGGGVCDGTCAPGFGDCNNNKLNDGCEKDVSSDPNNCGACNAACNLPNTASDGCVASLCTVKTCRPNFGNCDAVDANGCETDVRKYFTHCGSCNPCPFGKLCTSGACAPPAACFPGNDTFSDAPWVVCATGMNSVWMSALGSGTYHAGQICKQLGLPTVAFGGNCGRVCGYCPDPAGTTSCGAPGTKTFDGGGFIGADADGPVLGGTVTWECTP